MVEINIKATTPFFRGRCFYDIRSCFFDRYFRLGNFGWYIRHGRPCRWYHFRFIRHRHRLLRQWNRRWFFWYRGRCAIIFYYSLHFLVVCCRYALHVIVYLLFISLKTLPVLPLGPDFSEVVKYISPDRSCPKPLRYSPRLSLGNPVRGISL